MEPSKDFISTFMIAVSNCSLYSKEHEAFDELAKKTLAVLEEDLKDRLEIMIIDDELIVNKKPLRGGGLHRINIIKRLKKKGISRVDFLEGITLSEIKQFIIDISEPGKRLKSYPHIRTGAVDIRMGGLKMDAVDINNLTFSPLEEIEKVKEVFHSAKPHRKLDIAGLEEVVVHFIGSFKKEANLLKLLSPIKSYSEYTYTHATNVSILSVLQAESLGIKDDLLHEFGMAALLHDAGKLFISREVLDKKGKLDDKEYAEIKKHPLYGARYLAKMDHLTRLAPIIAFEHHIKYDGSGYPDSRLNGKKQHICSQIVAISDFFDALRSRRPYRESWETGKIVALMKKNAGKDFNPMLLNNFTGLLRTALN
ncbi:MAG TPA: HD domain-containing protein [Nitrospirae bacterium]|nr:cyclic di-GMP phosphodiesterase response regulator RpfG [bacterium BMS3Abin06]HDH12499.1 HD domain-containing protein [Nitrospirota bacterium]HDZ02190.1 HD domain-containing protein [Nitrospirota bacterium]